MPSWAKWALAWVFLSVMASIGDLKKGELEKAAATPVSAALFLGICWVIRKAFLRLSPDPCPHCGKRAYVQWLHSRKDGGPDFRFKVNYLYCCSCGCMR
jgi:hypothetical protein